MAIRKAIGRGAGYWEFADSMESVPFRIKDSDVDALLAEPRFRALTIWYLSDPRPVGLGMCLGPLGGPRYIPTLNPSSLRYTYGQTLATHLAQETRPRNQRMRTRDTPSYLI